LETGFLQRSGLNFPIGSFQIVHFVEMPIPGNEDHPVMLRRGSNPDVVLGQRPPLSQETTALSAANRSWPCFRKGGPIFAAPKNNSPSTTAGMKTSSARSGLDSTASISLQQGDRDISVQQESTNPWRQLARSRH
jgi:hypothetical protein